MPSKPGARRLGKARGAKFAYINRLKEYADRLYELNKKIFFLFNLNESIESNIRRI